MKAAALLLFQEPTMTPKDAATCTEFWKQIRSLTEIAHTRGAEGLIDALMEDFTALPAAEQTLVRKQLTTLIGMLPMLKQASAACAAQRPANQRIPYRD
jgi:hypothetical protein